MLRESTYEHDRREWTFRKRRNYETYFGVFLHHFEMLQVLNHVATVIT